MTRAMTANWWLTPYWAEGASAYYGVASWGQSLLLSRFVNGMKRGPGVGWAGPFAEGWPHFPLSGHVSVFLDRLFMEGREIAVKWRGQFM
jgi:hypothetical protein